MAQEAWRAYLELALGMTEATRKKATKAVRRLVGKGGVTAEQLQALAEELVKTSTTNREALTKLVRYELDRALGKVGLATAEEVAELTRRVRELEADLRVARTGPSSTGQAAATGVAASVLDEPVPTPRKKAVAKKIAKKATARPAAGTGALIAAEADVPAGTGGAEPAAPPAARKARKTPAKTAPVKKTPAKKVTKATTAGPAKRSPAKRTASAGGAA